jgi:hypothetical protein
MKWHISGECLSWFQIETGGDAVDASSRDSPLITVMRERLSSSSKAIPVLRFGPGFTKTSA